MIIPKISLTHNEQKIDISAKRLKDGVEFATKIDTERTPTKITDTAYRNFTRHSEDHILDEDGEIISIRERRAEIQGVVPFDIVRKLPTPIFLGLDRTTIASGPHPPGGRLRRAPASRRPHATLRAFLDESVAQAEAIAVEAIRRAQVMRSRRAGQLREEILLTLFSESQARPDSDLPRPQDLRRYEKTQRSLKAAFSFIGIPEERIASTIDPFFIKVTAVTMALSRHKDVKDVLNDQNLSNHFFSWLSLKPRLSLLSHVESLVNKFNEDDKKIFAERDRYLQIMNSFLRDSKKQIEFREDGTLSVHLPSGVPADVYYLSSGERQLFVLITTLMFSDEQKRANSVIIDEPELSLHIKWQEMFVDALLEANPKIQLVLATHSPSIISGRSQACVDLQ